MKTEYDCRRIRTKTLLAALLIVSGNFVFLNHKAYAYDRISEKTVESVGTVEAPESFQISGTSNGAAINLTKANLSIGDIYANFNGNNIKSTGDKLGGAIYNKRVIGNITGNIIGNYIEVTTKTAKGGAIYNTESTASIGIIKGTISGNYVSSPGDASGGAIFNTNSAVIEGIEGLISQNSAISSDVGSTTGNNAYGGAIYNNSNSRIKFIDSDFSNNSAVSNSTIKDKKAQGGAIYNKGIIGTVNADNEVTTTQSIGNLIDNYAKVVTTNASITTSNADGGAIYNDTAGRIYEDIYGVINGNYVASGLLEGDEITGKGTAQGGTIYNAGVMQNITATNNITSGYALGKVANGGLIANNGNTAVLGNVTLQDVANVYAKAANGTANGGLIYNNGNAATIGNVTLQDVINVYAKSASGAANGGLIYNNGSAATIGDISLQNVSGVYAKTENGAANGGVIYSHNNAANATASIGDITAEIVSTNYVQGTSAVYGGVIDNFSENKSGFAKIGNIEAESFSYNTATSSTNSASGGVISNRKFNAQIGNIKGNFSYNQAIASTTGKASGGAIYNYNNNCGSSIIGNINGNFSNNSVYAGLLENLTIKYAGGDASGGAISNLADNASGIAQIGKIVGNFEGNSATSTGNNVYGGAISNKGTTATIASISGSFSNNYISSIATASGKYAYGGAIYNTGIIGSVEDNTAKIGSLINNIASTTSTGAAYGGAIYNTGKIYEDIFGEINGNYAVSGIYTQVDDVEQTQAQFNGTGTAQGGTIYNSGTLQNITATKDITSGYAKGKIANGGFISNNGNTASIGNVTLQNVSGVYAQATNGTASGGVIYNHNSSSDITTIENITAKSFEGNYVDSTDKAYGGVIDNVSDKPTGVAKIGTISGDFIDNYVKSANSNAYGGAIANRGTTAIITSISGNFVGNSVTSGTYKEVESNGKITLQYSGGTAEGGAIYNNGVIGSEGVRGVLASSISNNSVYGASEARGAAIYNSGTIYGDINASFDSNNATSINKAVQGGVIYNTGSLGLVTGTISNIEVDGVGISGGLIYNKGTIAGLGFTDYSGLTFNANSGDVKGLLINNDGGTIGTLASDGTVAIKGLADSITVSDITISEANSLNGIIRNSGIIYGGLKDFDFNNITYEKSTNGSVNGGVLYWKGGGSLSGKISNVTINAPTAQVSGAGIQLGGQTDNINVEFSNITVNARGLGAALNNGGVIGVIDENGNITQVGITGGTKFVNNSVDNTKLTHFLGGAALYNQNSDNAIIYGIHDVLFEKNSIEDACFAPTQGGAVWNWGKIYDVDNASFIDNSNTAAYSNARGGAYFNKGFTDTIKNSYFEGNTTENYALGTSQGGAFYNEGLVTLGLLNNTYKNNSATSQNSSAAGGAIYNGSNLQGTDEYLKGEIAGGITGSFEGNYVKTTSGTSQGGAIFNGYKIYDGDINATFKNNYVITSLGQANGGAIANALNIDSELPTEGLISSNIIGTFEDNYAVSNSGAAQGGAIYNEKDITGDIKNSTFNSNYVTSANVALGGALYNSGNLSSVSATFANNYALLTSENEDLIGSALGGALYNSGVINKLSNSTFASNYVKSLNTEVKGGAIYNEGEITEGIQNVTFNNNFVVSNDGNAFGGALYNSGSINKIVNTSFTNNYASSNSGVALGGAIFTDQDLTIEVNNGYEGLFGGNYVSSNGEVTSNAIYVQGTNKARSLDPVTLTLDVNTKAKLVLNDTIDGQNYNLRITGDESGNVYINNKILNANIEHNNVTSYLNEGVLLNSNNSLAVNSGTININHLGLEQVKFNNFSNNGTININSVDIDPANEVMGRFVANSYGTLNGTINVNNLNILSDPTKERVDVPFADMAFANTVQYHGTKEYYTPIYRYDVGYDKENGNFYFLAGGSGSGSSGKFNPAILATNQNAQAGSYGAQSAVYDYMFEHSDSFMPLPFSERFAIMNANKYATNFDDDYYHQEQPIFLEKDAIFTRPYASFEHVRLNNGPSVNVINYGTFVGGNGQLKELKHGWWTVPTYYIGYNGSSQHYSSANAYSNGGLVGTTQTFYNKNFFAALTLSAGGNVTESHTSYGKDDYTSIMGGAAAKAGYNLEMKDGKYIIQPIWLMSYTFINTFNYRNAAGVKIDSDPLHVLQFKPGVKFMMNCKHHLHPYIAVNYVWNAINENKIRANDVRLPNMSPKPFVEYGVGLQKCFDETNAIFAEAMIRSGGRQGVMLNFGFRWHLGRCKKTDKV